MKKLSLSLLAAGVMAAATMAHADAIFYPDGTHVELGANGADSLLLSSRDDGQSIDTTVLGAGPMVTTSTVTTVTPVVNYVYVQPNINFDPAIARSQLPDRRMHMHSMTTTTPAYVVGSTSIPYASISEPYYVMSW